MLEKWAETKKAKEANNAFFVFGSLILNGKSRKPHWRG